MFMASMMCRLVYSNIEAVLAMLTTLLKHKNEVELDLQVQFLLRLFSFHCNKCHNKKKQCFDSTAAALYNVLVHASTYLSTKPILLLPGNLKTKTSKMPTPLLLDKIQAFPSSLLLQWHGNHTK